VQAHYIPCTNNHLIIPFSSSGCAGRSVWFIVTSGS
jgi:hypothetical protein